MEVLSRKQNGLFEQFKRMKINIKKCPIDRRTRGYYSQVKDAIQLLWNDFRANDIELRALDGFDESEYAKSELFVTFDLEYTFVVSEIADALLRLDQQTQVQPPPPADQGAIPAVVVGQRPNVKLPTITLPCFSGEYHKWQAFHDMYVSLIHRNNTLSNVEKFHYLKGYLSGPAASLVRHTDVTNDNYPVAWELLRTRFANKRAQVDVQLKAIINYPCQSTESAAGIGELIDQVEESLNALRTLQINIDTWDPILLFVLIRKLSNATHTAWQESQKSNNELATYAQFKAFLNERFRMLETLDDFRVPNPNRTSAVKPTRTQVQSHTVQSSSSSSRACPVCQASHAVRDCSTFLAQGVEARRDTAAAKRICFNCLNSGHFNSQCKMRTRCQTCNGKHHTLLHINRTIPASSTTTPAPTQSSTASSNVSPIQNANVEQPSTSSVVISHTVSSARRMSKVLLATAIVRVRSRTGENLPLRALIDQGSEVSFITENASQLLGLKRSTVNVSINGIGGESAGRANNVVEIELRSPHTAEFSLRTDAFVIKKITGMIPQAPCGHLSWPHIDNLRLADPMFATPGCIDLLLGGDVYKDIITSGTIQGENDAPLAQSSVFGWILSGRVGAGARSTLQPQFTALHTCVDIDTRLRTFWEIECIESQPTLTVDEQKCEEHFVNNFSKADDGRYVVRMPLRPNAQLGDSRNAATRRFLQLERKLSLNPQLKESYVTFMREYLALGHMQLSREANDVPKYFIPHHAVFKASSSTTKVRVVFDASTVTSNGRSLNELMYIGPRIQDELSSILLRWRKYPHAYSGDIEKMYRQIWIHTDDHRYQHILWRESPNEELSEFALRTITYGTSCAPHLAVRTLVQLAHDNAQQFPRASAAIRNDFYVDDFISGSYTTEDAIVMYNDLCRIMEAAGFKLRKWVSNCTALLAHIPEHDRELKELCNVDKNETVTALGIVWRPSTDEFMFKLNLPVTIVHQPTKRSILSEISKLFDPLGWLAPIIVRAKILMQQLWVTGLGWDDSLPEKIVMEWKLLREDLFHVDDIRVDRWCRHEMNSVIELHAFSDASLHAYAAAVYARCIQSDGSVHTTLLTAKTRVAPLKQVSIPRLELCGAVLAAELLTHTKKKLQIDNAVIYAWTDSSIVLHWLRALPCKWTTFVGNRVSAIQQATPICSWRHVPTKQNPADCASRGLDALQLKTHDLWWHGPEFLMNDSSAWPTLPTPSLNDADMSSESKRVICNLSTNVPEESETIVMLGTFSSLSKLLRVTAYCKRFSDKCRKLLISNSYVTLSELSDSLTLWIRASQNCFFPGEFQALLKDRALPTASHLRSLNLFVDDQQIIRVGGRLQNADLAYHEKHPILLSNKCHLTKLIIGEMHSTTMHGGPQLVLNMIRKKYWILNGKNTVRFQLHRCVKCFRQRADGARQLMGSLPHPRVNISRAFTHAGVDFAGPISLRMSKGRGNATYKGYIAIFICLCTKAMHIEVVSDLSSNAFIAAYRRFVSRRGLPAHMYSDNATNFTGAEKILRKAHMDSMLQIKTELLTICANHQTEWHFIPPASPHFGGLWEAGVKSLKYHLKRSLEDVRMTYEELATLVTQIEACLNSRPLSPMSSDPTDLNVLTPGHFLIGDALLAPPDRSLIDGNQSLLCRWKLTQRLYQSICKRWQNEYLSRLQQRPKWQTKTDNLKINDMVLLKENNIPSAKWPLGRIVEVHPGADGLVRVVSVRTASSIFKRCITKVCPLPC